MNSKVGLIVPVFNVENTIERVLNSLSLHGCTNIEEILIIDNHSSDKTVSLISSFISKDKVIASRISFIQNNENYGYGSSIKTGFEYFLNSNVDHVMVIHGDLQVDPGWLVGAYLKALNSDPQLNFILASRFMPDSDIRHYSLLRRLGNYFFNTMTFLCSGLKMSDAGSAMIVIGREVLASTPFLNLSNGWQFHPQLNILIYGNLKSKIKEIPMGWSDSEAPSSVVLIRYGLTLLKMLLDFGWKKNILKRDPNTIFYSQPLEKNRNFTFEKKLQMVNK